MTHEVEILLLWYSDLEVECWRFKSRVEDLQDELVDAGRRKVGYLTGADPPAHGSSQPSAWAKGLEWTAVHKNANRLTIRNNY